MFPLCAWSCTDAIYEKLTDFWRSQIVAFFSQLSHLKYSSWCKRPLGWWKTIKMVSSIFGIWAKVFEKDLGTLIPSSLLFHLLHWVRSNTRPSMNNACSWSREAVNPQAVCSGGLFKKYCDPFYFDMPQASEWVWRLPRMTCVFVMHYDHTTLSNHCNLMSVSRAIYLIAAQVSGVWVQAAEGGEMSRGLSWS